MEAEATWQQLIFSVVLVFIVSWFAKRGGFFKLPLYPSEPRVSFVQLLGIFLIYMLSMFVAGLVLFNLRARLSLDVNKKETLIWFQLIASFFTFLLFVLYTGSLSKETRRAIFWDGKAKNRKNFLQSVKGGILAWLISYPFVLLASILTLWLTEALWGKIDLEQVAVRQLKLSMDSPLLYFCMILLVVFFVPFLEELLFRGFLQTYLRRYLGKWGGIGMTSLLFASAHYATSQGASNLQLIASLFVLSLFICFIYEKERVLWAPVTFHVCFNGASALWISLEPFVQK